jgi:hypothetical protein
MAKPELSKVDQWQARSNGDAALLEAAGTDSGLSGTVSWILGLFLAAS